MRQPFFRFLPLAIAVAVLASMLFRNQGEPTVAENPHRPVIAASSDGTALAGFQAMSGQGGEYELYLYRHSAPEPRGRFRGMLAGLAADDEGGYLALTRDGALVTVGDDPQNLALPDSRWNMAALAWHNGQPVAINYAANRFTSVVPDGDGSWRELEPPVADDANPGAPALVRVGGTVHLIWPGAGSDPAGGAFRHCIRDADGVWREAAPLPLGTVAAYAAFAGDDGLCIIAAIANPIRPDAPTRLTARRWRDGTWSDAPELTRLPDPAAAGNAFAAAVVTSASMLPGDAFRPERLALLTAGPAGARLYSGDPSGHFIETGTLAPGVSVQGRTWLSLYALLFPVMFLILAVLQCRRSRLLSRRFPGLPADLISRAAALAVDWLLVSIGVASYHIAAGNVHIQDELLNLRSVDEMFWTSLAALAIFAAVLEAACGRTPGKQLAGIRVRSLNGGPPSVLQSLLRNAARGIDMMPFIFPGLVGALAAMFNPLRQRLGDIIGSTVVRRHTPLELRRIVLASRSPRRRELLEARCLPMRIQPADIDEDAINADTPAETARLIAEAKAKAIAVTVTDPLEIVVGADTIVVLDGEEFFKPIDADEARRMLARLSGRSHQVFTGVSVWDPATGRGLSDVEQTDVEFRNLSEREIDDYVATGDPLDKAGGYSVQSGYLVKQVRGSFSNVAGLPMEMLERLLHLLDS
ncbi:MAG: Maf family nucleotide pyrophosphatase [Planctomycetes bacterium]|nr:Maf family nucleotide pyrophosphatase [Planctomycetota bacterium]